MRALKEIKYDRTKPRGVASRAADLTKARRVLGWEPKVSEEEGFRRIIEWYFANRNVQEVKTNLEKLLIER